MVPEETPVALSYAGTTHAVMMASPADFEDFALGFSLTEGIIASPDEIEAIEVEDHGAGIDIQIRLKDQANTRFEARRRRLAGPVGCGLCGIESIEEAMRAVDASVRHSLTLDAADIVRSVKLSVEGAAAASPRPARCMPPASTFPASGIVAAREDVGRHNALDKLAGALAKAGHRRRDGAVVVTSRVSVEMVQKTAAIGAPFIIAVSAPTALAIRTADDAGMTLVALVRGEDFDVFTHPERVALGSREACRMMKSHAMNTGESWSTWPTRSPASSSRCRMTKACDGVAKHINDFWDPRMRRQFFEIVGCRRPGAVAAGDRSLPKIRRPKPEPQPGHQQTAPTGR